MHVSKQMYKLLLIALALGLSACFPQLPEIPEIEIPEASKLTPEILSPVEKSLQSYR